MALGHFDIQETVAEIENRAELFFEFPWSEFCGLSYVLTVPCFKFRPCNDTCHLLIFFPILSKMTFWSSPAPTSSRSSSTPRPRTCSSRTTRSRPPPLRPRSSSAPGGGTSSPRTSSSRISLPMGSVSKIIMMIYFHLPVLVVLRPNERRWVILTFKKPWLKLKTEQNSVLNFPNWSSVAEIKSRLFPASNWWISAARPEPNTIL